MSQTDADPFEVSDQPDVYKVWADFVKTPGNLDTLYALLDTFEAEATEDTDETDDLFEQLKRAYGTPEPAPAPSDEFIKLLSKTVLMSLRDSLTFPTTVSES